MHEDLHNLLDTQHTGAHRLLGLRVCADRLVLVV